MGMLILLGGTLYGLRALTHVCFYLGRASSWAVRALVCFELLLAATWFRIGLWVISESAWAPALGSALVLLVAVILVWYTMALALASTTLVDASTRLEQSWPGEHVQWMIILLQFDWLLGVIGHITPRWAPSGLLYVVGAILATVVIGSAGPTLATFSLDKASPDPPASTPPVSTTTSAAKAAPNSPESTPQADYNHKAVDPAPVTTATPAWDSSDGPSWAELCGVLKPSARGAPQPQRLELERLFVRDGAVEAGCTDTPKAVGRLDGTWVMVGRCEGRLFSLAVVDTDGVGGMLLGEQAASLGLRYRDAGILTSVTERTPISSGSGYILETIRGPVVLIQRHTTARDDAGKAQTCSEIGDSAVAFTTLPPAMGEKWLALSQEQFTWPREIAKASGSAERRFEFIADGTYGPPVAYGRCVGWSCSMTRYGGAAFTERLPVDIGTIVRLAEAG